MGIVIQILRLVRNSKKPLDVSGDLGEDRCTSS